MIGITHWSIHTKQTDADNSFDLIHSRWIETTDGSVYSDTWVVGEQNPSQQALIDLYNVEGILPNWEQYLPPNPQIPSGPTFQRLA
tara:strand:+ start:96 stop:353 length:258 start_codon:yes stop_codon:yes gene_type:complete